MSTPEQARLGREWIAHIPTSSPSSTIPAETAYGGTDYAPFRPVPLPGSAELKRQEQSILEKRERVRTDLTFARECKAFFGGTASRMEDTSYETFRKFSWCPYKPRAFTNIRHMAHSSLLSVQELRATLSPKTQTLPFVESVLALLAYLERGDPGFVYEVVDSSTTDSVSPAILIHVGQGFVSKLQQLKDRMVETGSAMTNPETQHRYASLSASVQAAVQDVLQAVEGEFVPIAGAYDLDIYHEEREKVLRAIMEGLRAMSTGIKSVKTATESANEQQEARAKAAQKTASDSGSSKPTTGTGGATEPARDASAVPSLGEGSTYGKAPDPSWLPHPPPKVSFSEQAKKYETPPSLDGLPELPPLSKSKARRLRQERMDAIRDVIPTIQERDEFNERAEASGDELPELAPVERRERMLPGETTDDACERMSRLEKGTKWGPDYRPSGNHWIVRLEGPSKRIASRSTSRTSTSAETGRSSSRSSSRARSDPPPPPPRGGSRRAAGSGYPGDSSSSSDDDHPARRPDYVPGLPRGARRPDLSQQGGGSRQPSREERDGSREPRREKSPKERLMEGALKRFQNGLKEYDVGDWNWADGEDHEAFVYALVRLDNIGMIEELAVSRLIASLVVEKLQGALRGWWQRQSDHCKQATLDGGWPGVRRGITQYICTPQWTGAVRELLNVVKWKGKGHREETPIEFLDRKLRLVEYVYPDETPQLQLQQLLLGLERWITALRITNAEMYGWGPDDFINRIMQEGH